jgi:alpha-D-ribose 1-methylphosphonate 5-triphosphate diphosphatase
MRTITLHPARSAGLADRGEIAPGRRADLVRVRLLGDQPVVRTVWRAGERVA